MLHEEHAVAIAHGYAKVTGQPMGVLLHSNVGLMHATMAIFNAWCDRVPIVLLGATGPVDAAQRRPWIDWIHTARDQGALVRHYVKWDDQPASAAACLESIHRANIIARTAPKGPVYLCFDAAMQEGPLGPCSSSIPRASSPPRPPHPAPESIDRAAALLAAAARPLILAGRVSRDPVAWQQRVALAERLGAKVLTDLKVGSAFPTDHPLHAAPPVFFLSPEATAILTSADVILSLDWLDLAGTLKAAWGGKPAAATVIQSSCDQYVHNGWSMDHQGLAPTDLTLLCEPDIAVAALLAALQGRPARSDWPAAPPVTRTEPEREPGSIGYLDIAESPVPRHRRAERGDDPPAAGLAERALAFPRPALLPGLRRRRRRWVRPGSRDRRRAGAQGQRTPASRADRRRRLPHGIERCLDGRHYEIPCS